MNYKELIAKLTPGIKIKIKGTPYTIKQHIVWMQHRCGVAYDKWVLVDSKGNDGYRLFIDSEESTIGFAKIFHHNFQEPMPMVLHYNGKTYRKVYDEFCTVVKAEGEPVYKVGDGEIWWDYVLEDNDSQGLSLGRSWETWKREDLTTRALTIDDLEIEKSD